MEKPTTLRLVDYRRPPFTTSHVNLDFQIFDKHTIVNSVVTYDRSAEGQGEKYLSLDFENPNPTGTKYVTKVKKNGVELSEGNGFHYEENLLHIDLASNEDTAQIEIETYLEPHNNKALSGLYKSDSCFVTQCESEGFRRITPFLDRPDVMAKYTVRVEADKTKVPVLMANGNTIQSGQADNGRHFAIFEDPWAKPSYLFCTASGDLECLEDTFTTKSGRKVACRMYTEKGESHKGRHALDALIQSMKWDEDVFDCEYDLDNFNVVAVSKFNFGAMENKGLNVFRDSLIMATPEIATDLNYQRITDVIGHEYFHNYSGNRVTLANWFNISLKEGLTVIREQMFTAFTTSQATERIDAVKVLRSGQFATDDSPLAHPVMPQEVLSVENCYTSTIYEKGAEVIRMMKVMMGEKRFIEGVKDYFKTYDGQAVTIKEFVASMEKVSGLNLHDQFSLWYTQSGRPRIKASGQYDAAKKQYVLTLEQSVPPTHDQPNKNPMVIPIEAALVNDNGADIAGTGRVIVLDKEKQEFIFENVSSEPAFHSLLRGFSAPVDINTGLSEDQLYKQLLTDSDGFNRWDAGQKIAMNERVRLYNEYLKTGKFSSLSKRYIDTLKTLLSDVQADATLIAQAITPPDIKEIEAVVSPVSPSALNAMNDFVKAEIALALQTDFENVFARTHDGKPYEFNYNEVGKRNLKRVAITFLLNDESAAQIKRFRDVYFASDNMTDKISVMSNIAHKNSPEREEIFNEFFNRFKDDQLTVQKWFSMQATSDLDNVISKLKDITKQSYFNWENPGHVGSLYGGFSNNYKQFHRKDGAGYEFLADGVIKMDAISPNISSRLIEPLCRWETYTQEHGQLMLDQLRRIAKQQNLSKGVKEKLLKSIPDDFDKPSKTASPSI
jgi:aminopeptidase N